MTLVPASTPYPAHGITTAETGVNMNSFDQDYEPEFIDPMLNYQGERRAEAIGAIKTMTNMQGEILATANAPMTHTFVTACTLANVINLFAPSTGIHLLNSAKASFGNTKWADVSLSYRRHSLITAV